MPKVCRLGDRCTGHGCYPPRPNSSASKNVIVNRRGAHRLGDSWPSHCCFIACHTGNLAAGSKTVIVNGRQLGRIGDPVSCGSAVAEGSPNVIAGG